MMPSPGTEPTVGLIPTMPQVAAGDTIDPFVSVPTARAHSPAATATAEPELDPLGFRSRACGLRVCPPRPLQPLTECVDRKFAHSLRFVLPSMTTPALRSRVTSGASA